MKIDVRSKESVYITINGVTYYIDDSTDEQIVELYKGEAMIKYVPDTYAEGGGLGKDFDYEKFDDWWFKKGGFSKTEKIYGKQASLNADKIDPKNEMDNVYSDELEKLGRENNLHLKDSTYAEGGEIKEGDIIMINPNKVDKINFGEFIGEELEVTEVSGNTYRTMIAKNRRYLPYLLNKDQIVTPTTYAEGGEKQSTTKNNSL